jgi:hypothetical protein
MWFSSGSYGLIVVLYQVAGVLPAQTYDRSWGRQETKLHTANLISRVVQVRTDSDGVQSDHPVSPYTSPEGGQEAIRLSRSDQSDPCNCGGSRP